ncbi:MAG: GNAT family N-acetyltransferase [Caldilineaceae bacterium]
MTIAETADQAKIGGVFTHPRARGRGLGQAVVSALCAELLAHEKQPVLYWVNPIAGAIYRKLGFRTVGNWRAVRLQRMNEE